RPYPPLFSLWPPRPQRYALFPYTTLFRSRALADRRQRRLQLVRDLPHERRLLLLELREPAPQPIELLAELLDVARPVHRDRRREDRKSTRLNSSHVKISYAVLCLHKKTQT